MIDVLHKKCLSCGEFQTKIKYKGYCIRCFVFIFPNEEISRNFKVKEKHMSDYIKEEFKNEIFIFDKQIGGCSKRRPDCYIDIFTHIVIIECDENQHKNYEQICDNKRTMEIFQDFNSRPIVFIRFNPDNFKKGNEKIPSSFRYHKTLNIPIIRNKEEWFGRLKLLHP
jgi:hypothetical protein